MTLMLTEGSGRDILVGGGECGGVEEGKVRKSALKARHVMLLAHVRESNKIFTLQTPRHLPAILQRHFNGRVWITIRILR
jgi:hypothetical protein